MQKRGAAAPLVDPLLSVSCRFDRRYCIFSGKVDTLVADLDDLDRDHIAHADDIFCPLNAVIVKFADMDKPFLAGSDLDLCADREDPCYFTIVPTSGSVTMVLMMPMALLTPSIS